MVISAKTLFPSKARAEVLSGHEFLEGTLLNPGKTPSELSAALKRIICMGVLVGRGLPDPLESEEVG